MVDGVQEGGLWPTVVEIQGSGLWLVVGPVAFEIVVAEDAGHVLGLKSGPASP